MCCSMCAARAGLLAGLYCATQPSLSGCTGITITCWAGAYPGLNQHFLAANLDPKANHWNKARARGPAQPPLYLPVLFTVVVMVMV